MQFTILSLLMVQFSSVKYIRIFMQRSLKVVHLNTEPRCPLNTDSPSFSLQLLATTFLHLLRLQKYF